LSKDGETAGSVNAPDKVDCQCGWDGEEDDMVGWHTDICERLALKNHRSTVITATHGNTFTATGIEEQPIQGFQIFMPVTHVC
jgi:hypothetical protein